MQITQVTSLVMDDKNQMEYLKSILRRTKMTSYLINNTGKEMKFQRDKIYRKSHQSKEILIKTKTIRIPKLLLGIILYLEQHHKEIDNIIQLFNRLKISILV